jgi:outer membrane protein OmpA-like peptidoglycan-associated protein
MKTCLNLINIFSIPFIIIACTTIVKDDPMVLEAREAYLSAEKDSQVVKMAPIALEEAKESLEDTERLAQKGASKEELEHSVYMTKQRILIAKQKAKLNAAEQAVENAHEERRDLLIEARKREADIAKRRAEKLSKQIEELGARKTDRGVVLTLGDVLFAVDKSELSSAGLRVADKVHTFLTNYPKYKVLIEGHTDNTGSEQYNQVLSERRANAVRDALVNRGTSINRILTKGYGELRPIEDNSTYEGRRQNRRVEIVFSNEQGLFVEK